VCTALGVGSCTSPPERSTPLIDESYVASIDEWHAQRVAHLTEPDNYLSLIGLYWLSEGENTFGSAPSNVVVLPAEHSPAVAGSLVVSDQEVIARAVPGSGVMLEDQPLTEQKIASDADGLPDILTLGDISFYVLERGGRLAVRVKDPNAQTRIGFTGIERFEVDPRYRINAEFIPFDPPQERLVSTIIGTQELFLVPGLIKFEIDGVACELLPVIASPDAQRLFLIFSDLTSSHETYGAGRFLYCEREHGGTVTLDFNKAINPPCAFTKYATCPLPPPDNKLPVRIEAGEKRYGDH